MVRFRLRIRVRFSVRVRNALFMEPVAALPPDDALFGVLQRLGAAAEPRRQPRELQQHGMHLSSGTIPVAL